MALYPTCHKTVFVMDHGPYFALPCQQVEYDVGRRTGQGFIPLTPITKTVWTSAVEAVSEYCRIVWDIFPKGDRLIRVVVGKEGAHKEAGEEWSAATQIMPSMLELLANVGRPSTDSRENSVVAGVRRALELLCQLSPKQREVTGDTVINRGRIVVVTALEGDNRYKELLEAVEDQLTKINEEAAQASERADQWGAIVAPLAEVEVTVVHTQPSSAGDIGLRTEQDMVKKYSSCLNTVLHTAIAGPSLANKLLSLCLAHYTLASTTVTGIPMKEEQNASSSANYDVELFHVREAHEALVLGEAGDLPVTKKEECEYMTVTLKWCTPRGSAGVELHHTSGTYRITPTEVNSRQSSCLTNFLLSGRSVMLEMQRRASNTKTICHMLTSHGGEIFIHTLPSARSALEDPPSISEGPGGRVTDYRIPDLAQLMKTHRLAPWPGSGAGESLGPGSRARMMLDRATRVFPVTINSTTIFNMGPVVGPMLSLLQQETLPDDGVAECQKVIYNLIGMENKGESLPSPLTASSTGKKSGRKEEQYRLMFSELEKFVIAHSGNSPRHHQVLECLMQVRNKPMPAKREAETELSLASRELERYQAMSERERLEYNSVREKEAKENSVKVEAGPTNKKQRTMGLGGKNLYEIYKDRLEREAAKKHVEFAGRRNLGEIAKLYIKMESAKQEEVV